jgi:hypothetical protein
MKIFLILILIILFTKGFKEYKKDSVIDLIHPTCIVWAIILLFSNWNNINWFY